MRAQVRDDRTDRHCKRQSREMEGDEVRCGLLEKGQAICDRNRSLVDEEKSYSRIEFFQCGVDGWQKFPCCWINSGGSSRHVDTWMWLVRVV